MQKNKNIIMENTDAYKVSCVQLYMLYKAHIL